MQAVTLLDQLRTKLRHEREEFLRERLGQMQHLSDEDRQKVAQLTEDLLDRVLLEPAERLRSERRPRRRLQGLEALRDLFGLDREKP